MPLPVEKQVLSLYVATSGSLDAVPVAEVRRFEQEFLQFVETNYPSILKNIATKKALDDAKISYQETPAEQYELPNKAGSLAQCLNQFAAKGINMNSICAMAAKGGKKAVVVYTVEAAPKAAAKAATATA